MYCLDIHSEILPHLSGGEKNGEIIHKITPVYVHRGREGSAPDPRLYLSSSNYNM